MVRKSQGHARRKRAGNAAVTIEALEGRALFSTGFPAAPEALTPGSSASPGPVLSTVTPTLKWTAVAGVSGYQVHVYDKTLGTTLSANLGASTTSYTIAPGALRPGDPFVWNVRDLNGTASGAVSNYLDFQVPALPAPTVKGPGSSASPGPVLSTLTPTFSWDAVTSVGGFTGYQINLYDRTAGRGQSFVAPASATSYTLPAGDLVAGHSYVWNLRLRDGSLTGSESLPYLYFRAPAPVTLPAPTAVSPGSTTSPGPTLTNLTPTLRWDAVTGVSGLSGYQVNLYDLTAKQGFSYKVGASATQYTVAAGVLTPGDHYVWNVRVLDGAQSGPPSAYLYFVA